MGDRNRPEHAWGGSAFKFGVYRRLSKEQKELTAEQTGTMTFALPMENYWLFSIEDDGRLSSPISKPDGHHILEFLSEK